MSGIVSMQVSGRVAWVTLTHAGKFNAMSREMWRSLKTTFEDIQTSSALRCVVIRGAQGHFCAGGDIAEYPSFRFNAAELEKFHEEEVWGGLQAMLDCDVPLIAALEGNCMGAGLEIASCCDIRLSADDARFGAPIARLGFPMAPRESALVSGAVGETMARAMLLAAETLGAAEMLASGFLTRTMAAEVLTETVQAMALRIAALAPQAARMNKRTFRMLKSPVAPEYKAQAATENIANSAYAYANTPEHNEGIDAFLNKRKPEF